MFSTRRKSNLSKGKKKSLSSKTEFNVIKQNKQITAKQTAGSDRSYIEIGSDKTVSASTSNMGTLAKVPVAPDTNQEIFTVLSELDVCYQ